MAVTESQQMMLMGIFANALTAVSDRKVLPPPDCVANCLTRVFCQLLDAYLLGEGGLQTELAALLEQARNADDPLMALLSPMERTQLTGMLVKPLQSERQRILSSIAASIGAQ